MTQPSGITIREKNPGTGGFQAPGQGRLFFFDSSERGPDLAEDLEYGGFEQRFGANSRAAKLAKLYSQQRGANGRVPGRITFARVRSATAVKATRTLLDRQGTPLNTLRLDASGAGLWGNTLSYVITDGRALNTVTIEVRLNGATVELYPDVTMDASDSRYAVTLINRQSAYLRATDVRPVQVFVAAQNPATGTNSLATGTDGAALTNQDFLDAMARFSSIRGAGILYSPNPASAVATAMLAHGNYKFAVIDTPLGQGYTLNKTLRDSFNSSQGMLVRGEAYTVVDPNALLPLGIAWAAGQLLTDAEIGPHMPFSNVPVAGLEDLALDYLADVEANAANYELNGITTFRRLADGGVGPFGLLSLTASGPFRFYNVRRTFWYVYEQLQRIIQPVLHRRSLNFETFRDIDNSIVDFFEGIVEPRGMTVGPGGAPGTRGQGWDWKADGETTPQGILDAGGLYARLGLKVPRALAYVEIEVSEFEAPALVETAPGVI